LPACLFNGVHSQTKQKTMKNLFTIAALALALQAAAQTPVAPRSEFSVALSEDALQVKSGETKSVTVAITRSKLFTKGEATWGFSTALPAGVTIAYIPSPETPDSEEATITVGPAVPAGSYALILNATVRYKTKGTILKLLVTDPAVAGR
jgi:hypothetical protein